MAALGVLVVIRQMSFFSDAIGHSALTGIALGILLNSSPFLGALGFTMLVAALIVAIRHYSRLKLDTILGILFPSTMALGVILLRLTPGYRTDLVAYLFGDILTVSSTDVGITLLLIMIVGTVLLLAGKPLFSIALNEDLAKSEGINTAAYELLFLLTLAAVIAMAIKLVGIVLVTAMLIIPAATAQNLARSITSMFAISVIAALTAVSFGMIGSAILDIPSGPAIVLAAAFICVASFVPSRRATYSAGSALLGISLVVFSISLALAGFIWYQDTSPVSLDPTAIPTSSAADAVDVLSPQITIDETLAEETATIQTNLITPIRQYYATQDERLAAIAIVPHDDETYPALVSLTLVAPEKEPRTISFLYDLSHWKPSHLDND
jgi:zinc transport system permease protein